MNSSGTRERLLDAASELFGREGYHAVSVRDIVREADANLGAVTYHFGSKEALYHAAIQRFAQPMVEHFAAAAAGPGSGLDRLEGIVRFATSRNLTGPNPVLRELATDRPLPPPMVQMMQRNFAVVVGLIREGQRDGSVRRGDPALLGLTLMANAFFFRIAGRILSDVAGIDRANPRTHARLVDLVAGNVRRALGPDRRGR